MTDALALLNAVKRELNETNSLKEWNRGVHVNAVKRGRDGMGNYRGQLMASDTAAAHYNCDGVLLVQALNALENLNSAGLLESILHAANINPQTKQVTK